MQRDTKILKRERKRGFQVVWSYKRSLGEVTSPNKLKLEIRKQTEERFICGKKGLGEISSRGSFGRLWGFGRKRQGLEGGPGRKLRVTYMQESKG